MKRRFQFFLASLAIALLTTSILGQHPLTDKNAKQDAIVQQMAEAVTLIESNYAGEINYGLLTKTSILGMLHSLDPHSNYMDKKDFDEFQTDQSSQYFGIGAQIGARNGQTYILSPFPNTPAERAGLRYGDHIIAVDNESTLGWPSIKVAEKMRGPRGTTVEIKVERPGEPKPLTFKIVRDAVPLPSVINALMLQPGVGYIKLGDATRGFAQTTGEEVRRAIEKLKSQGMTSLILDIRDNPGGLVSQAEDVSSNFLMQGQKIYSLKSRVRQMRAGDVFSRNTSPERFPLVVIINRNSASASEIVAGALQDHDRAVIVGETSFGKGLVQSIFQTPYGGGLTLTTGRYYTPSGRSLQRDYSKLSYYDYIYQRSSDGDTHNQKRSGGEERRTDAGRAVFGGGGVEPDIEVKSPTLTEMQLRLLGPVFAFTRQLINGQIAGLSQFKLESIQRNHVLLDTELVVDDKVLNAFRNFIKESKDFRFISDSVITENAGFLKERIRAEAATAHFGMETSSQALFAGDPQLKKAIEALPQAEKMAKNIAHSGKPSTDTKDNKKTEGKKN